MTPFWMEVRPGNWDRLSRDVVIDQGIGRTQQTLSLWRRLLTSVRDRYLVKKTSRCTKENGAQWNKQSAGPSLPSPGRAYSTPGTDCPRGGNTAPTICHGLIQTALEKGANRKWKAAVWSPTRRVAQATEGQGGSSQIAELKAIQLALDIAEREKWPRLYLYTDSWMSQANEEHHNNEQVDKAAKVKVSQVDLDWQHKGEVFLARWAHDASGHQGRDATYRWARDRGVDLTMENISQVIHNCETCAAIKQAKRVKPLWYGGRWLKYRYGEAWQIDYINLPQTRQGKRYVLTMVEATTGWLETYPVPHATARNTILGLEKQVLWRHGTPERIESDNGTHFKNGLINTWAREHGIEWIYHIPYHAPAAGKVERCNGLLKTTLKALGGGTFKNWELNLAKATWMVNTRGSINRAGPAQSEPLHTVDGDKVPVVHMKGILGKTVWINPTSSKGRPIRGIVFAQGPGSTWWVMQKDGETRCVPQGDLI
ncbi:hypothetical protein DUI87_07450 [Hirundo rustica rustica]|uniref:Integrase catalytic domain-containing protein n=1 Tax=Hirundo rustica rustica TaxID=333673 RepID=A0A3M0KPS9_HIRRU|nr:hypothetical protein DUI87_07450 [Hirundo rustica rustica]